MAKLLWTSDVHLDHLPQVGALEFGRALGREESEATSLVVTGDIGEARSVVRILREFQQGLGKPVYFVLGNHDYYRGSFQSVDQALTQLDEQHAELGWLRKRAVWLERGVALAGTDGWYDARFGDEHTDLVLNDFLLIRDLFEAQEHSRDELLRVIRTRADYLARGLAAQLDELEACDEAPQCILVGTHVPPFQAAAWHQGQTSDDRWAPFFSSKATGEVLLHHAEANPEIEYVVLCGHTHGEGVYWPLPNLVVYTARARYGAPELAGRVDVSDGSVSVEMVVPS